MSKQHNNTLFIYNTRDVPMFSDPCALITTGYGTIAILPIAILPIVRSPFLYYRTEGNLQENKAGSSKHGFLD